MLFYRQNGASFYHQISIYSYLEWGRSINFFVDFFSWAPEKRFLDLSVNRRIGPTSEKGLSVKSANERTGNSRRHPD